MGIKFVITKSAFAEIRKSVKNENLEALKKEVIAILEKKEKYEVKKAIEYFEKEELRYTHLEKSITGDWIEKAGYGVGTVRIWKGKKYKKVSANPTRWVRVFDKHDRGAATSIGRYIAQVKKCESVEELYQFCMKQRSLFQDENGVDLPIMDKLRSAIGNQETHIKMGEQMKAYQKEDLAKLKAGNYSFNSFEDFKAEINKQAASPKGSKQTDYIGYLKQYNDKYLKEVYDAMPKAEKTNDINSPEFKKQFKESYQQALKDVKNLSDSNLRKELKHWEDAVEHHKDSPVLASYMGKVQAFSEELADRVNAKEREKESEAEKHQNRSDAMKGNKNAYKGGPKDEPKDYSHMSQTELEKINKESFEKTKQGDDEAYEIHKQVSHQMNLNERKVLHKKHMKYEETLEGKAAYLDEMISYATKNIDSTNKQLTKLKGKKDGKSLMKHNKLVDYLHENQAEFEALTQLKNDLYDDWDKMQKEIADNYKGKMKSKEGKKWESAIENANSITELQNIKFDNEYDSFYDKNPNVSDEESNNLDADYQETTKMFNEKMDALIDKGKNDYAAKLINANLELKDLENILARVKANDTGMIGDNEDLPKKERIAILDSLIETEKNLIKEREEKIANAGDYTKLKVENKNNFTGEKQGIAAAVVDTDGKKITIPGNKNLAKELDQMMEVAEIGKIRSDNRLNYIGVSNGYLVATNGRSLKRIKVDGLPADLEGAYDIKIDGDNAVLTKKNYNMTIPKYDRVFPSNNNSNFELDNKATIAAIKELKKINYFKETHDKMKITINKNGAFIGSKKIGSGFNGEEREIYVNPNLLIPTLTNSAKSNISFDNDGVEDNKIIRALGISTNIGDSLLMPMRVDDDVPNPDSYAKEHGERNEKLKNSIMESFNTDLQQERMNGVSDELKKKATNFMSSLDTKKGYEAKNEMITALPLIQRLLTEDRFKDMGLKPEFGRIEDSKYVLFRDKNGDSFRVSQFDTPSIAKFFKQLVADGEFGNVKKSLIDDEYFEKSFIYEQPSMFETFETVKNIMDSLHRNR